MQEKIYSPIKGHVVPLNQVPDDMFAKKMLGDGIAIDTDYEEWVAPVEGTISVIYNTLHAIGITTKQGTELLLHIGLDTYDLKGIPFDIKVKVNDKVDVGDPLVAVNIQYIKGHGYNSIAPIISLNKKIQLVVSDGFVDVGDVLFLIKE